MSRRSSVRTTSRHSRRKSSHGFEIVLCLLIGAVTLHFVVSDPCLTTDPLNGLNYVISPGATVGNCVAVLRSSGSHASLATQSEFIDHATATVIAEKGLQGKKAEQVRQAAAKVKAGGTIDSRFIQKISAEDLRLAARYGCDRDCIEQYAKTGRAPNAAHR